MDLRLLKRDELPTVWTIDRSEVRHHVYRMVDGALTLTPHYFENPGWNPDPAQHNLGEVLASFDRGGICIGAFAEEKLIGFAVVDAVFRGPMQDQIQLMLLYVSRPYRQHGLGKRLFEEARTFARNRGAAYLYISATPTENTVQFYRRRGAFLADPPDPELLAREPDDIHLLCPV
jgi:GNAT superfamily N-acetyltransferase